MVKGFQKLEWQKPSGARNEPLDLEVYCLAMLELVKRRYNRATMWDQIAQQSTDKPKPTRARPIAPPSPSFMTNW
jgi:phage terminase large subunit GpA-like protein